MNKFGSQIMRHPIAHARRHGQPKCKTRSKRYAAYAFLMGAGFGSTIVNVAYALPGVPTVINGDNSTNTYATISPVTATSTSLTITQNVPNLAISWAPSTVASTVATSSLGKSFDIQTGETVTF